MGDVPLCVRFPRLFSISLQKDILIRDLRVAVDGVVRWGWLWRRNLFAWEHHLLLDLSHQVPVVSLSVEEDVWLWGPGEGGVFSVNSAYHLLGSLFSVASGFGPNDLRVLNNIWKVPTPSKVIAFAWKVLRNRIPTRLNLAARGIPLDGALLNCVHCDGIEEGVYHLFLTCDFAYGVWLKICRWLCFSIVMPRNLFMLFEYFVGFAPNKKVAKGFALIWLTTVWAIWRSRNEVVFSNGVTEVFKVVDDIKHLSWQWGMSRRSIPFCLFYEWCCEPGICLR
jgi:hypothetical protein